MKGMRIRKGGLTGILSEGLSRQGLEELLRNPDRLFSEPGARILKQMGNTRTVRFSFKGKEYLLKHYLPRGWVQSSRGLFGGSRGRKALKKASLFRRRGIPTPQPVALLERRRLGLPRESYLCFPFLPEVENLTQRYRRQGSDAFLGSGVLEAVARGLAALHRAGLYHGDLKWSNLLVSREVDGIAYFVDLDGAGVLRPWRGGKTASDVSRFLVNLVETMESPFRGIPMFVEAYRQAAGLSTRSACRLIARVRAQAIRTLGEHALRQGRAETFKAEEVARLLGGTA